MTRRIPTLETERLLIRELTIDDLHDVNRILNEAFGGNTSLAERERWLQWTVLGYEMFANLEQPHYGERGIELKATGELIGAIGIVPYIDSFGQIAAFNTRPGDLATAEVGLFWALDPAYHRQGYATEAARKLVYYLTRYERLHRIIATTGYGNQASEGVMRKIGMVVEHAEKPQPPDIFVVGVLDNRTQWKSRIHALIRHPDRPALWLRRWKSGWGLPRAQVPKYVWNAQTDQMVAALQQQLGGPVWYVRAVYYWVEADRKRIECVAEVEVFKPLKDGEWVDRQRLAGLTLREEHLRPALEAALQERETGEIPALRPVWSRPGSRWREEVREWTGRDLAQLGHRVTALEQLKFWSLSAVLRVKTDGPDFYFKVPARLPLFVEEAVVTQKLAAHFPDYVPAPVAIDRERGWMLFRDFGRSLNWHTRPAERAQLLRRFAGKETSPTLSPAHDLRSSSLASVPGRRCVVGRRVACGLASS